MDNLKSGYTYVRNTVWAIKTRYPFVRVGSIGKSVKGRDIFTVEIGRADVPKVLFTAGMSGSDNISGQILLKFADSYCDAILRRGELSGIDIGRALSQKAVVLVPLANPDGSEISSRGFAFAGENSGRLERIWSGRYKEFKCNARGIDLDRNFDSDFDRRRDAETRVGIHGPDPRGWSGDSPFSEPESVALRDLCIKENFSHCIRLFAGLGEIFWRDEKPFNSTTPQMAKILSVSSGYALEAELGPASPGAMRKWFSRQFLRPAIDVGLDQSVRDMQDLYSSVEELLAVSSVM